MRFATRRGRVALCALSLLLLSAGVVESRGRSKKPKRSKLLRKDTIKAGVVGALRKGPGDSYKPAGELAAGTPVDVIALNGRWAHIRSGRTNAWILRRSLSGYESSAEASEPGENAGSREWGGAGTKASFSVTVASENVVLHESASDKAKSLGPAPRGTRFEIVGRSENRQWLEVRSGAGTTGWIPSDVVQSNTMADVDGEAWAASGTGPSAIDTSWKRSSLSRFEVMTRLGVGYRSIEMDFSSAGAGELANTITESQAMAAQADLDLVWRSQGRRLQLGLDARFRTSYAKPGIEVIRDDMSIGDVAFAAHESRGGVRAGVVLGDVALAARMGGRYDVFLTRDVANAGLLPRESLSALVGGARLDWYRLSPEVVLTAEANVLAVGRLKQTVGLEDGENTKVRGASGEVRATYHATRHLDVVATFQYRWSRYTWTGQSARNPDVMQSQRSDHAQNLGLGIAHRF